MAYLVENTAADLNPLCFPRFFIKKKAEYCAGLESDNAVYCVIFGKAERLSRTT